MNSIEKWEIRRRTGEFVTDPPYSLDETNALLAQLGQPLVRDDETFYQWAVRTETERGVGKMALRKPQVESEK